MNNLESVKYFFRAVFCGNIYIIKRSIKEYFRYVYHWGFSAESVDDVRCYMLSVLEWLKNATAVHQEGGISSHYNLITKKYLPPFPETTGYLIPTLVEIESAIENSGALELARQGADWLIKRQREDGSIRCNLDLNTDLNRGPDIVTAFDCGAILRGFIAIYSATKEEKYCVAAESLSQFLQRSQQSGAWPDLTFFDYFGSHNSLVGYSLILAGETFNNPSLRASGIATLERIRSQIEPNGFIRQCQFHNAQKDDVAFLHPLAYTVEGYLKTSLLLKDDSYLNLVTGTIHALWREFELRQSLLASHYDFKWRRNSHYSAFTANAQVAEILFRVGDTWDDLRFTSSALKMTELLRTQIDIHHSNVGIRGGCPGSFPIYGDYDVFAMNNWGAKYFLDASMLELAARERFK